MQSVIARFHCDKVAKVENQWSRGYSHVELEMTPVNGNSPADQPFASSSPGGDLKLILSHAASDEVKSFFKAGKKYNVIFEPVEEDNGV